LQLTHKNERIRRIGVVGILAKDDPEAVSRNGGKITLVAQR
jgi:hypothetical protein